MIVALLLALNVWYDYHHPLGIMFDVVLGVGSAHLVSQQIEARVMDQTARRGFFP